MNLKKVVAVIVEGPSDETALGTIMTEFFQNDQIKFVVVHGDITTDQWVDSNNVVKKVNTLIMDEAKKYGYKRSDFEKIIHIVDSDGVYVSGENIKYADTSKVQYYMDRIETNNVDGIIARNTKKAEVLYKLRQTGKVNGIPYRVYFNSCNLEHVLHNQLKDFSDQEKEDMAYDFADKYEGDVQGFIDFISSREVAVPGSFKDSWSFLEQGVNSLNRFSNMHLIFAT